MPLIDKDFTNKENEGSAQVEDDGENWQFIDESLESDPFEILGNTYDGPDPSTSLFIAPSSNRQSVSETFHRSSRKKFGKCLVSTFWDIKFF